MENRGCQCQALVCQGWQSYGSFWRQQFRTSDRRSRFASVDRREKPLFVWRTFRVARYNLRNNSCVKYMCCFYSSEHHWLTFLKTTVIDLHLEFGHIYKILSTNQMFLTIFEFWFQKKLLRHALWVTSLQSLLSISLTIRQVNFYTKVYGVCKWLTYRSRKNSM